MNDILPDKPLMISEIFGPTIQGEGSAAGQHCLFVRTAECNLRCSWCDTAYTWSFNRERAAHLQNPQVFDRESNITYMSSNDVLKRLSDLWDIRSKPTLVVFSGGEPMMQNVLLAPITQRLRELGNSVHVETAGTILPSPIFDTTVTQYNVSPKLAHSGNREGKRYKRGVLTWFAADPRAWFKYVVRHSQDLDEVEAQVIDCDIPRNRVMIMPEGTTAKANITTARAFVDTILEHGFGLSLRSHVLLWSDVRGK